MTEIDMKYGFPLFSRPTSLVSLGKNKKLVISDMWSFWDYVIKKASKDRKKEAFLSSLLEQAKHFYITAESSPVKSQPLLYYYSFLNFAKIIINLNTPHGYRLTYMHGMSENHNNKFAHSQITKQRVKTSVVQVAHTLISEFDPSIPATDVIMNVRELLNHCVGVHRTYSEIYNQPEIFFRLEKPKLYKNGKTLEFKAEVQCTNHDLSALQVIGYSIVEVDGVYSAPQKLDRHLRCNIVAHRSTDEKPEAQDIQHGFQSQGRVRGTQRTTHHQRNL